LIVFQHGNTISSNGTTKQKPRLDLNGRSHVKDNYQKARKTNERFEKSILNHISNPHQDMFTQIE